MLVIRAGIHKMLVRISNSEDPDQTVSSDLGLYCLSWQRSSVRNFRTTTVHLYSLSKIILSSLHFVFIIQSSSLLSNQVYILYSLSNQVYIVYSLSINQVDICINYPLKFAFCIH